MKSLENKLIVGIIAIGVLLLITGIVSYRTLTDSIETEKQVAETHEILTEVEATLSTIKDAETGQRGFLIAGQENYLEPFHQANAEIDQRLNRLKKLTAHNARHRARLAAADPLIKHKFDELHRTVKLRRDEGFESAQRIVLTNEGKEKMDELRRLFGEIKDEESGALQTHLAQSETDKRNAVLTFVVLFALIIALLLLIFFLIKRDTARRNLLEARLSELARTDALTELCNRGEFDRRLALETARAHRYKSPLTLLIIDLDFFKAVNDRYGHQIGDEVLRWVAQHLAENARTSDATARYGGEEFAVVLPETNTLQAATVAERLRSRIAALPFRAPDHNSAIEIPLTASIGLAELQREMTGAELIEAADQALYQAKKEGRNRVIFAGVKNLSQGAL